MKKLIALAVAAAAMPAMADISLSGSTRVEYVDQEATTTAQNTGADNNAVASKSFARSDLDLNITATSEMDNGMAVSTSFQADDGDSSANLTISGSFGTVAMGDADMGGALDSVDGAAVGTARDDLSAGVGADTDIKYTLPTLVEGLTVIVSHKFEGTGTADITSAAVKYTNSGVTVFAGQDSYGAKATTGSMDDTATGMGVSYAINGLTVGYGNSESRTGAETDAVAVGYTMGNLTIAYNSAKTESNVGVTTNEEDTVSAEYNMGGGVKVYVSSHSVDKDGTAAGTAAAPTTADADNTRVGFKFAF